MALLARLDLTDFRNWAELRFSPQAPISIITGPNGSGKTNLLEAISLLVPGRGLRAARLSSMARRDGSGSFAVASLWHEPGQAELLSLGTGFSPEGSGRSGRRKFLLNGAEPPNQHEIAAFLSAVWITPQMDHLFEESASGRRRFLDRLVVALEPMHAREAAAYEASLARRNHLLTHGPQDPAWFSAIEDSLARHGVALAASRANFIKALNATEAAPGFARVRLEMSDEIAFRLASSPALEVEGWFRAELAARRARDSLAGHTELGAHRADMRLFDARSGEPAATASTGQRRALLLSLILSHAALIAASRCSPPLLLLDEPLVHLDTARREALLAALSQPQSHIFMTGTEAEGFAPLRGEAEFFAAAEGRLCGAG